MGSTSKHSNYDFNVVNKIITVLSVFYTFCANIRHTDKNGLKMVGLETNHNPIRRIGFQPINTNTLQTDRYHNIIMIWIKI